eukprot:scaffold78040_cov34-Phaeocystis_antarctica.AAC.1
MYPGGDWRHLLRTSPKRTRPICVRAGTSVVVDHSDVGWQPCHYGRGSGREQPGECGGDSHDGGWR